MSWGIWFGLGIYALLLIFTVTHIFQSHRSRWDKAIAVLSAVLLPVGGMLDWWCCVVWGSRADQLARRNQARDQLSADQSEVGK